MRIVVLIDEREVIELILRHFGLWDTGVGLNSARAPPGGEGTVELFPGDLFPDGCMDTAAIDTLAEEGLRFTGGYCTQILRRL